MDTLCSVLGQHLHRYFLPLGEEGRKSATDSTTTGRIKSNSRLTTYFDFRFRSPADENIVQPACNEAIKELKLRQN